MSNRVLSKSQSTARAHALLYVQRADEVGFRNLVFLGFKNLKVRILGF